MVDKLQESAYNILRMTDTRRFFHDRVVLFLLTINGFLALVNVVVILLRLGGAGDNYIQSYRSNLGLSAITVGGVGELVSFVIFAVGVFVISLFFAMQFHKIRVVSSWIVMILTTLLLILNFIVANALLDLR